MDRAQEAPPAQSAEITHLQSESNLHEKPAPKTSPSYIPDILRVRVIRRPELRKLVPLSDTTIYEMEQRGEFPRRYYLTSRCVVWNLAEVEDWLRQRQSTSQRQAMQSPGPDVRKRRYRPVRS